MAHFEGDGTRTLGVSRFDRFEKAKISVSRHFYTCSATAAHNPIIPIVVILSEEHLPLEFVLTHPIPSHPIPSHPMITTERNTYGLYLEIVIINPSPNSHLVSD